MGYLLVLEAPEVFAIFLKAFGLFCVAENEDTVVMIALSIKMAGDLAHLRAVFWTWWGAG